MQKARALALVSLFVACAAPAHSQGMMEGTFVRGLGAGMGAGTAASLSKGKTVRNTYEQMLQAQRAMLAQTKAIEQYVATGAQMEAKKQWANAEQYFQSALQLIAKRDGPGSPKSAPVLQKLAKVSKEQHKLDQAIGYQKTVVAFANRAAQQNPTAAVQAQADLSSMYIDKGDFANAEGVLKQSTEIVRRDKTISPKTYSSTLKVYGVVLRQLKKTAEADLIDAELALQSGEGAGTAAATHSEPHVSTAPNAVPPAAVPPAADESASTAAAAAAASASSTSVSASSAEQAANSPAANSAEPASSASTASPSANGAPPSTLLPPPTADWPVMGADGKIVSEPSAPQAQSSEPSPPTESPAPAETSSASSSTPVSPPAVEEVKSAPAAETADSSKAETK